ncbi:MAG: NAD(P)(+) transhydrogenase (Re/Si-specific) subunit beta, partial [SAR324 cluster bacterium]
ILEVEQARAVLVLKRSMAPGFAGIDNDLFYRKNTSMVFGDAKKSIEGFIAELKELK